MEYTPHSTETSLVASYKGLKREDRQPSNKGTRSLITTYEGLKETASK
jgi:hypothetical protein